MKLPTTLILVTICLTAMAQTPLRLSRSLKPSSPVGTVQRQKTQTFYPDTHIHSESRYTDSTGLDVIIQNSLPKGGTETVDKDVGYRILWTRVINESAFPIELNINFPADSIAIPSPYGGYLELIVPQDTMSIEKETAYSYGLTDINRFLDSSYNQTTSLQRTINPKEESAFYVLIFIYNPGSADGQGSPVRTGFTIKEQEFFYRINLLDSPIPCGLIALRK